MSFDKNENMQNRWDKERKKKKRFDIKNSTELFIVLHHSYKNMTLTLPHDLTTKYIFA